MCLNASLAGLVAITAPCDVTDAFGAIVIGAVAGLLGVVSVAAWTAITITVTFLVIKTVIGFRVDREEEMTGLDETEHGLLSLTLRREENRRKWRFMKNVVYSE